MKSYEQVVLDGSPVAGIVLHRHPDRPGDLGIRLNWLVAGALLGAAGSLLALGVVFAVLGAWLPAAGVVAALCLCLLGMRGIERRRHDVPDEQDGQGSTQARPDASVTS
ncbi:MAG TPA: hypothetical protein VFV67_11325 [Actinophytocola sp.]|uniref:hypothetical protein n=1 Tax=Actinophytocola sp. TaxID=1872138 RepID=UPI002DB704B1|nr:hypothetical protein [Actinophytocola sp.]HEU5471235.1 hypothetical protein [Actinophytocola sp.]